VIDGVWSHLLLAEHNYNGKKKNVINIKTIFFLINYYLAVIQVQKKNHSMFFLPCASLSMK